MKKMIENYKQQGIETTALGIITRRIIMGFLAIAVCLFTQVY